MCTGAFDLLSVLQSCLLVVYWLTGQGKDPDLGHLAQHVFLVAAEREDLASLRRMLHHLREVGRERGGRKTGEMNEGSVGIIKTKSALFSPQ